MASQRSTVGHAEEVEGERLRADPQGARPRGGVDPGAVASIRGSSPRRSPGAGVSDPSAAQEAAAEAGAGDGPLEGDHRGVAGGGQGGAEKAAPHRQAGLAAPRGGARRRVGRVHGAQLCDRGPPPPAVPARRGLGPSGPSARRRGRGGLRHGQRVHGGGAQRCAPVHPAAVGVGARVPAGVSKRGARGVLGRPRPGRSSIWAGCRRESVTTI